MTTTEPGTSKGPPRWMQAIVVSTVVVVVPTVQAGNVGYRTVVEFSRIPINKENDRYDLDIWYLVHRSFRSMSLSVKNAMMPGGVGGRNTFDTMHRNFNPDSRYDSHHYAAVVLLIILIVVSPHPFHLFWWPYWYTYLPLHSSSGTVLPIRTHIDTWTVLQGWFDCWFFWSESNWWFLFF